MSLLSVGLRMGEKTMSSFVGNTWARSLEGKMHLPLGISPVSWWPFLGGAGQARNGFQWWMRERG